MKLLKTIFFVFCILFTINNIYSVDFHSVNKNSYDKVWEYGNYKIIENNCGNNIFIPTKTKSEYDSFLNNIPSCVKSFTSNWVLKNDWYGCTANPTWSSPSSCSVSCGTGTTSKTCSGTSGTEYRDFICTRSDGLALADNFCYQIKPSTSQACTRSCSGSSTQSCYAGSCYYGGGSCFLPGTKITLGNGSFKNIEDINIGEKILSYDEDNKKYEIEKVLELESPIRNHYYTMTFDDFSYLKLTDEHPIYSMINGKLVWAAINPKNTLKYDNMNIEKLSIGDKVFTDKKDFKRIISLIKHGGSVLTYNLKSISNTHTFFTNDILVHNKDGGSIGYGGIGNSPGYGGDSFGGNNDVGSSSGTDSGGGSWSCFTAGTKVKVFENDSIIIKNIENVIIGDYLLGNNGSINKVLKYDRPITSGRRVYSINNDNYFVTAEHMFLTPKGWKSISPDITKLFHPSLYKKLKMTEDKLSVGDEIYFIDENNKQIKIKVTSIKSKEVDYNTQLYNFKLDGDHTYTANNFIVHNK